MSSSQWENLLRKFVKAFKALGIYLYDSGRIVVLEQKSALGLAILRRNILEQPSTETLTFVEESGTYVAIVNELPDSSLLMIVLCLKKNLASVKKHWSRTFKVVSKKIPLDQIVEEESIQTKMVRSVDAIDKNLDQLMAQLRALQMDDHH
ncbi:MAG: hypothetical protein ACE5OZ_24965 [Candidatus Heimdallarchaeota archaeon]